LPGLKSELSKEATGLLTFGVFDDLRVAGLHDRDTRVGCAKIDSHDAATKGEGER